MADGWLWHGHLVSRVPDIAPPPLFFVSSSLHLRCLREAMLSGPGRAGIPCVRMPVAARIDRTSRLIPFSRSSSLVMTSFR